MSAFPWHLVPSDPKTMMPEEVAEVLHDRAREKFLETEFLVYTGPLQDMRPFPVKEAEDLRLALQAVGFDADKGAAALAWFAAWGHWATLEPSHEMNAEHLLRFLRPKPAKTVASGNLLERFKIALDAAIDQADDTGCSDDLTVTSKEAIDGLELCRDELAELMGRGDDPRMEAFGNLMWSIFTQLLRARKAGEIPDNWDHNEIRQWLADQAAREVFGDIMKGKRLRDMRRDVANSPKLSSCLG